MCSNEINKPIAVNRNYINTATDLRKFKTHAQFGIPGNLAHIQIPLFYGDDSHCSLRRKSREVRVLTEPEPTLYNAGLP